jgi:hypothetical protein
MAAFANGLPWGRMVSVRGYLRCRGDRWENVVPHLRKWPRSRRGQIQIAP